MEASASESLDSEAEKNEKRPSTMLISTIVAVGHVRRNAVSLALRPSVYACATQLVPSSVYSVSGIEQFSIS